MLYVIWSVYEDSSHTKHYIINQNSSRNKIQSVWRSLLEARAVCDKLNKEAGLIENPLKEVEND